MATTIRSCTNLPFGPERAWELLCDRDVIHARTAHHESLSAELTDHRLVAAPSPSVAIETQGTMPASWLPAVIARRARDRMPSVHRTEVWELPGGSPDDLQGRMTFAIHGVEAASAHGRMHVVRADDGSELCQEVVIMVRFPWLGTLIERSLSSRIHESLAAEGDFLARRCPGRPRGDRA